jgi:hypothetical protein
MYVWSPGGYRCPGAVSRLRYDDAQPGNNSGFWVKTLLSEAEQRWHVLSALFPDGHPGKYASDLNITQDPMLGIDGSIGHIKPGLLHLNVV